MGRFFASEAVFTVLETLVKEANFTLVDDRLDVLGSHPLDQKSPYITAYNRPAVDTLVRVTLRSTK
eukprot:5407164-Ditylum_brightwellii.AAC.1